MTQIQAHEKIILITILFFWDVIACSLVYIYKYFEGICCLPFQDTFPFVDGGNRTFRSIGTFLANYKSALPVIPYLHINNFKNLKT